MAAAQVIIYEGPKDVLAWKSNIEDFDAKTNIIVHESQEAVFYKNGAALDLFGSGRHKLDRLPLLRRAYEKITKNPSVFHCEVYYVNKAVTMELLWGTSAPIQLEDPRYGIIVDVKSFGSYKIGVADSRKFLVKTVGTVSNFTAGELQDYYRNEMVSHVKSAIARAIAIKGISVLDVAAYFDVLSQEVKSVLAPVFDEYGLELKQFIISSIKTSEENLAKLRVLKEESMETIIKAQARGKATVEDAKAEAEAMKLMGTNYRERQTMEMMRDAVNKPNSAAGKAAEQGITSAVQRAVNETFGPTDAGDKMCPVCGAQNSRTAKFCTNCGKSLKTVFCPNCGCELKEGSKFCPECGAKVSSDAICPVCGTKNPAGTKFCSQCGNKLI